MPPLTSIAQRSARSGCRLRAMPPRSMMTLPVNDHKWAVIHPFGIRSNTAVECRSVTTEYTSHERQSPWLNTTVLRQLRQEMTPLTVLFNRE